MQIRRFLDENWRYVVFFVVTAAVLWLLYAWKMVLLPFVIGLVLAYLFMPVIRWLEDVML